MAKNKIASLFQGAAGINTKLDFKKRVLRVYVDDSAQAEALASLLKPRHELGSLHLDVAVYPGNCNDGGKKLKLGRLADVAVKFAAFKIAMKGNKYKSNMFTVEDPVMHTTWYFVEFAKKVCQYPADTMANAHGVESALPEDVAKLAFDADEIRMSTTYVK